MAQRWKLPKESPFRILAPKVPTFSSTKTKRPDVPVTVESTWIQKPVANPSFSNYLKASHVRYFAACIFLGPKCAL